MTPRPFFCSGTNRFGRPCSNRVALDGDTCGHCRGITSLPLPAVETDSGSTEPTPSGDDWTVAGQLQDRLGPLAGGNPLLERLVEVCVKLASNSRSTGSKVVYEQHWRTFTTFCEVANRSSELPVSAETVAYFVGYLAEFGRFDRESGERNGTGKPLHHNYIRQALSAIGYRHELHGLPSPTSDPAVRAVLQGYGRLNGTDSRGKDPIRLDGLTRIATTLSALPPMARRDGPLMLLATHPDLGLTAGQLAHLDGEHVLLGATTREPAALLVHPGGRSLHLDTIEINPDTDVPNACPVRALHGLAPDNFGPVFRSVTGQRLSRQGLAKIVRTAVTAAGLNPKATNDGLPRLTDPQDRARLARNVTQPTASSIRDLALILNLYWGTLRGSELMSMSWNDTRIVDQGVEWTVRNSKTDQLGKGELATAARNPNPLLCPATALTEWRHTLTGLLGHDPAGDHPVFVRLDRPLDHKPSPLGRDSASQIVKRAARAADLTGNYASHSLRSGFTTDALDAGATREQVQRQGRWNNIRSIDSYYRRTETWGTNNASQILAGNTDPSAGSGLGSASCSDS